MEPQHHRIRHAGPKPVTDVEVANLAIHHASSCAETIFRALDSRKHYPLKLFGERDQSPGARVKFNWLTYGEVFEEGMDFAAGAQELKLLAVGDTLAVAAPNCVRGMIALLAGAVKGAAIVPLSHTLSPADATEALSQARVGFLLCDAALVARYIDAALNYWARFPDRPPAISIAVLPKGPNSLPPTSTRSNLHSILQHGLTSYRCGGQSWALPVVEQILQFAFGIFPYESIVAVGAERRASRTAAPSQFHPRRPEDVFTIVFTSGSSGSLKGATFPNAIWKSRFLHVPRYAQGSLTLLHEPLCWTTGYGIFFNTVAVGGQIAVAGDLSDLLDEAELLRPTRFTCVPSQWKSLKERFDAEVAALDAKPHRRPGPSVSPRRNPHAEKQQEREAQLRHEENRRRVSGRFVSAFACCGTITFGGSATSKDVIAWMCDVFGEKKVRESYGTTETGGIAEGFGGGILTILPHVHFKIRDVPDMGYFTYSKPYPRGELLVRSDGSMASNYTLQQEFEGRTVDGFFCTGDVVELHGTNGIKIVDRVSNIVKIQQGVFVTPGTLSEYFASAPSVTLVFIFATPLADFVVAVVVPDLAYFLHLLNLPVSATYQELLGDDASRAAVAAAIEADFRRLGHRVQPYEVPRQLILADEPFTVESGLLTASGKPCRSAISTRYAEAIASAIEAHASNVADPTSSEVRPVTVTSPDAHSPSAPTGKRSSAILECILRNSALRVGTGTQAEGDWAKTSLPDLGVGSLQACRVQRALQREFSVTVPVSALLSSAVSVQDILSAASSKGKGAPLDKRIDWAAERTLPPAFTDSVSAHELPQADAQMAPPGHVLLLGVTGFLGRHLLAALLRESSDVEVSCLVRGSTDRVAAALSESAIVLTETEWARIHLISIPGPSKCSPQGSDAIVFPNLSLDDSTYESLLTSIDTVVNAASQVDYVSDYSRCRAVNVELVKRLVEFCADSRGTPRPKTLHHISTTSVLNIPMGPVPRRSHRKRPPQRVMRKTKSAGGEVSVTLDEGTPFFDRLEDRTLDGCSGYVSSKAMAEEMLTDAREMGLPVVIHRVGMIGPSVAAGAPQLNNFVTRIFATFLQLGVIPTGTPPQAGLVLNPVDYVSYAIAFLALRRDASARAGTLRVTHFTNSDAGLSLEAALQFFATPPDGSPPLLRPVPYAEFRQLVMDRDNCAVSPLRSFLKPRSLNSFDTLTSDVLTRRVLQQHDGASSWPPRYVDGAYIHLFRRFLQSVVQEWY